MTDNLRTGKLQNAMIRQLLSRVMGPILMLAFTAGIAHADYVSDTQADLSIVLDVSNRAVADIQNGSWNALAQDVLPLQTAYQKWTNQPPPPPLFAASDSMFGSALGDYNQASIMIIDAISTGNAAELSQSYQYLISGSTKLNGATAQLKTLCPNC